MKTMFNTLNRLGNSIGEWEDKMEKKHPYMFGVMCTGSLVIIMFMWYFAMSFFAGG